MGKVKESAFNIHRLNQAMAEGKKEEEPAKKGKTLDVLPKYYANVCVEMPKDYSDYGDSFNLHPAYDLSSNIL